MDWIKTKYDRFLLLLAAIALLGVSVFIILQTTGFSAKFVLDPAAGTAKIPQPDIASVEASQARLKAPKSWEAKFNDTTARSFTSRVYIDKDGVLIDPSEPGSPPVHPPVDNNWISSNGLPLRDPNILNLDSDGDGFTNLEEWNAKTEPDDPKSHPDFLTKLVLDHIIAHPFNLIFSAVTSPGVYQVDALNSSEPTQFLSIGDEIKGSKFKLTDFKEVLVPKANGTNDEKSELTIKNEENGEVVVLVIKEKKNVGKDDAVLVYTLNNEQIVKRVGQSFALKVEPSVAYDVLEVSASEVKIKRKTDGQEYSIKKP